MNCSTYLRTSSVKVTLVGHFRVELAHIFDPLGIGDLRVLSQPLNGNVFHYLDKSGLEVDTQIQLELADGRWGVSKLKSIGQKRIDVGQLHSASWPMPLTRQ
jgi:hypothetical protein